MDEPFSALDPQTRTLLQDEVKNIQKKLGVTIIFVIHDMDEALKLADRIVFLDAGEIVQMDTPEQILLHPATDRVIEPITRQDLRTVNAKDDARECFDHLLESPDGYVVVLNGESEVLGTADIPEGQTLYQYVSDELVNKHMTMAEKLGFDNTYAIAATRQTAEEYQLSKVSDLKAVAGELVFGAEQGFFTLEGSMKYGPFCEYYGLNFKDDVSVDIGLKYAAIQNGSFDVTEVYATDGLNVDADLVILEDDLEFFPEYNGIYLIRNEILMDYPEIEDTLNLLAGRISTEDMSYMTYQVDVNGASVDDAAKSFLEERGLIQQS